MAEIHSDRKHSSHKRSNHAKNYKIIRGIDGVIKVEELPKFLRPSNSILSQSENKYKRIYNPKINIETVIANKLTMPSSRTSQHLIDNLENKLKKEDMRGTNDDRPFYYTRYNEMLSVKEFLDIYKSTETQRLFQDKQRLRARVEEAREKIEEIQNKQLETKRNRLKSSLEYRHLSVSGLNPKNMIAKNFGDIPAINRVSDRSTRAISSRISSQANPGNVPLNRGVLSKLAAVVNSDVNKNKKILDDTNTYNAENSNMLDEDYMDISRSDYLINDSSIPLKTNGSQKINNFVSTQEDQQVKGTKRAFTEPKFTEHEIYRHLIHLTASPRHLTFRDQMLKSAKERLVQTLFKDPRIMDFRIGKSLKKRKIGSKSDEMLKSNQISLISSQNNIYQATSMTLESDKNERRKSRMSRVSSINIKELPNKQEIDALVSSISEKILQNKKEIDNFIKSNQVNVTASWRSQSSHSNSRNLVFPGKITPNTSNIYNAHVTNNEEYSCNAKSVIEENLDDIGTNINPNQSNTGNHRKTKSLEKVYVPRKIPLRSEIEKKYNILQKISNNKRLDAKVKLAMTEVKKVSNNVPAIKNRDYVDLYI